MSLIEEQIRALQREVDALSSNQAPNPADIATFRHTTAAAGSGVIRRATFPAGVKIFQAYLSDSLTGYMDTSVSGNVVTFTIWAAAGSTLTVVSLSDFSLA